jgi:formate hydrogenlyase transcriptional activator
MIGHSAKFRFVQDQISLVAPAPTTVLIRGETGTGKELVARAIHERSGRGPFVKMNCAAIPAGLLESELFGHERGAFTGALAQRMGRLQLAHKGTLFLDEIGDMPLELQPKLLRALQEQEFERVGGSQTIQVDVRIVAATNHDLTAAVREKRFRADLYYRLNVFPISLPALRDRSEDIPALVRHFVGVFAVRMNKVVDHVPDQLMELLRSYHWPGNVRELQNFVERAVLMTPHGGSLHPAVAALSGVVSLQSKEDSRTLAQRTRLHCRNSGEVELGGGRATGRGGAAGIAANHFDLQDAEAGYFARVFGERCGSLNVPPLLGCFKALTED